MKLNNQKRVAAKLLKTSKKNVWLDPSKSEEIKEAITKTDMRALIADKTIKGKPKRGVSRVRARKNIVQKRKGRRKGTGSRKGKRTARLPNKKSWMASIRLQRAFIKELKVKKIIDPPTYHSLYAKTKGGFFRSKRHIKLYIKEHNLAKNVKK